jgi:dolichol-phosphate mannosyltransferase
VLNRYAGEERVEVVSKPNTGHGPTVLLGYRRAAEEAEWVFQCDTDGELSPDGFAAFWKKRGEYDALLGVRTGRHQGLGRRLLSAGSRLAVRFLFGPGIADVNVPYRLIRAAVLRPIVRRIPPATFAPNVVISGALAAGGARVWNGRVSWQRRRTATASLRRLRLPATAWKCLRQTLRCRAMLHLDAEARQGSSGG